MLKILYYTDKEKNESYVGKRLNDLKEIDCYKKYIYVELTKLIIYWMLIT